MNLFLKYFLRGSTILVVLLAGCGADTSPVTPTPPEQNTPQAAIPLWTDENPVMSGICFESALDAASQVFVLRNVEELIRFYDLSDNSRLCRHPVKRNGFDFSGGRILAGIWSVGRGCAAHHELRDFMRDDTARRLEIRLRFITEGTCNYELVHPFWIGLDGVSDYEISIAVE
jgi:hypothetical protein